MLNMIDAKILRYQKKKKKQLNILCLGFACDEMCGNLTVSL